MAFDGEAVIVKITDNKFRITGLSLAGGADGVIILAGYTGAPIVGAVQLPATPNWDPYVLDTVTVHAEDFVEINVNFTNVPDGDLPLINVSKTGDDQTDFVATLTNASGGEGDASGDLEIYVERAGR